MEGYHLRVRVVVDYVEDQVGYLFLPGASPGVQVQVAQLPGVTGRAVLGLFDDGELESGQPLQVLLRAWMVAVAAMNRGGSAAPAFRAAAFRRRNR